MIIDLRKIVRLTINILSEVFYYEHYGKKFLEGGGNLLGENKIDFIRTNAYVG